MYGAVNAWDKLLGDDLPVHERFLASWLDVDVARELFLEDVVPWIRSWDPDCVDQLRAELEFYICFEPVLLNSVLQRFSYFVDDEELVADLWRSLFVALFGVEPAALDRDEYVVVLEPWLAGVVEFLERVGEPRFAWDTPEWRAQLRKAHIDRTLAYRSEYIELAGEGAPVVRRWVVVSQGVVCLRAAYELFVEEQDAVWVPPAASELSRVPRKVGERSAPLSAAGRFVYSVDRGVGGFSVGDLDVFIEQLRGAGQVMGLPVDEDVSTAVAVALATDVAHGLPHQPWAAWGILFEAAHLARANNNILIRKIS